MPLPDFETLQEVKTDAPDFDSLAPLPEPEPAKRFTFQPWQEPGGTLSKAYYSGLSGLAGHAEGVAGALGELADVGPAKRSFAQHEATMLRAGTDEAIPSINLLTGARKGPSPEALAQSEVEAAQEKRRQEIKAPFVGIEKSAKEAREAADTVANSIKGSEKVAAATKMIAGFLPYIAEGLISPTLPIATGGLESYKGTFDQALQKYSKEFDAGTARRKAEEDATRSAIATAEVFAALPASTKNAFDAALSKAVAKASPAVRQAIHILGGSAQGGLVMGANSLVQNAMAKQTHSPELSWGDVLEAAAKETLAGTAATAVVHGVGAGAKAAIVKPVEATVSMLGGRDESPEARQARAAFTAESLARDRKFEFTQPNVTRPPGFYKDVQTSARQRPTQPYVPPDELGEPIDETSPELAESQQFPAQQAARIRAGKIRAYQLGARVRTPPPAPITPGAPNANAIVGPVEEHPGVPPRPELPTQPSEVRKEEGEQDRSRSGPVGGTAEPAAQAAPDAGALGSPQTITMDDIRGMRSAYRNSSTGEVFQSAGPGEGHVRFAERLGISDRLLKRVPPESGMPWEIPGYDYGLVDRNGKFYTLSELDEAITGTPRTKKVKVETEEIGFRPAIRLMPEQPGDPGRVVIGEAGETHNDIIEKNKLKTSDIDQRGFVNPKGEWETREQAAAETGLPTQVQPGRLHSTDLPEAKIESPNVFYDDAVKAYTATFFDEKFGNMHGVGKTPEEAISDLNNHLLEARKYGTWRSVEHPEKSIKDPLPSEVEGGEMPKTPSWPVPSEPTPTKRIQTPALTPPTPEPIVPSQAAPSTITAPDERKGSAMAADVSGETPPRAAAWLRKRIIKLQAQISRMESLANGLIKGGQNEDARKLERNAGRRRSELRVLKGELSRAEIVENAAKSARRKANPKRALGSTALRRFNNETEASGDDLLSFIVEEGGLMSATNARSYHGEDWWRENKAEWNGFSGQKLPPHHYIIFSNKRGRGQHPDQMADMAVRAHLLKEGSTSNDLWERILTDSKKRIGQSKQQTEDEYYEKEAAFAEAISSGEGKVELSSDNLGEGDMVLVGKEWFTVTKVTPEGDVVVKDGPTFGRQDLPSGKVIWVEKYLPKDRAEDWPEPEAPAAAAAPKPTPEPEPEQPAAPKQSAPSPKLPAVSNQSRLAELTDRIERGEKLNAKERREYKALVDAARGEAPPEAEAGVHAGPVEPGGAAEKTPVGNAAAQPEVTPKEPWQMTAAEFEAHSIGAGPNDPIVSAAVLGESGKKYLAGIHAAAYAEAQKAGDAPKSGWDAEINVGYVTRSGRFIPSTIAERAHEKLTGQNVARASSKRPQDYNPDHLRAIRSALAEGKPVPPEVLADYPDIAKPPEPTPKPPAELPARPKPRPLTPAEQADFEELTRIDRAHREANGPALTTDQTKRYEYLTALAGQMDLLGEAAGANESAQIRDLESKLSEMKRQRALAVKNAQASPSVRSKFQSQAAEWTKAIQSAEAEIKRLRGEKEAPPPPPDNELPFMLDRSGGGRPVVMGEPIRMESIPDIRRAIDDPKTNITDDHRAVLRWMVDKGLLEKLPGLRFEVSDFVAGGRAAGEYLAGNGGTGLARFLRWSEAEAPFHEFMHHVWRFLSDGDRQFIATLRAKRILADAPVELRGRLLSGLSSDAFVSARINEDLYHLTNDSEFFTWMMTERAKKAMAEPEAKTFVGKVMGYIKTLYQGFKDAIGLSAREDALWRKILNQNYEFNLADGQKFEKSQRELMVAKTPEELREQKAIESARMPAAAAWAALKAMAYEPLARFKQRVADELHLSDGSRERLGLPKASEMFATAVSDPDVMRLGVDNYAQARAAVQGSNKHIQWEVTKAALHTLTDDQQRSVSLKMQRDEQVAYVTSPGFIAKIQRWREADFRADLLTRRELTFKNIIATRIAELGQQIVARKTSDAVTDALELEQAAWRRTMNETGEVGRAMDEIVAAVYPDFDQFLPGGLYDLTRHNAARDFFRLYEESRARQGNPIANAEERRYARLAAQVLNSNYRLAADLLFAERMKQDPDFTDAVRNFGRAFSERLNANPTLAMKELLIREGRLSTKAEQARATFKRLNREVAKEIEKAQELEDAVMADSRIKASPEWREYVDLVHKDAGALAMPDLIREKRTSGELSKSLNRDVINEQHADMRAIDPSGRVHVIDLGFSRASVEAAQPKIREYLQAVDDWLYDPANRNHPDQQFWQQQHDFYDATYNTLRVLDPSSQKTLGFFSPWSIPEFFFRQANLPGLKVLQTAFENWHRACMIGGQWSRRVEQPLMKAIRQAVNTQNERLFHGMSWKDRVWASWTSKEKFDTTGTFEDYRTRIFNHLAWEYRHGRAVRVGQRINGYVITADDLAVLKAEGEAVLKLLRTQKNLGAERVMQDAKVWDEWKSNTFAVRDPQEFGAEPGTTVPRDPSNRARALCERVVTDVPAGPEAHEAAMDKLEAILDHPVYFKPFVITWLGERSGEYNKATPFEHLFQQLYSEYNNNGLDAPRSLQDIYDFIAENNDGTYDARAVRDIVLSNMESEIRRFHKTFFEAPEAKNGVSDIRVIRATHDGPFTKAYERDLGSSFFYDYGIMSAGEVFSMAIDSSMFHMVRLARSLESAEAYLRKALAPLEEVEANKMDRKAFLKRHKDLFKRGEDFRDFETLRQQLQFVQMMRERLPIFGGKNAAQYEGFQHLFRLIGDLVTATLSGVTTISRVLTGSIFKAGFVLSAMERSWATSIPFASVSMAMSTARIALGGPLIIAGRRLGILDKFEGELSGWAEEMFRVGHFFNEQYRYGLGTVNPTMTTILNNIAMPYSHGRGYDPKFSDLWLLRVPQKAYYRTLSAVEAPLEVLKAMLPAMGYAIAYDSVARQMYWGVGGLRRQAVRSFLWHQKRGTLGQFDLDDPKSLKNVMSAEELLPRGLMPKTANQLAQVREFFNRGTDQDLQEAVIRYWKALSTTPAADWGKIRFLASEIADPKEAQRMEEARFGALASIGLFDIHHASPANSPWAMRESMMARAIFPISRWFAQSTRQIPALLGRAPFDRKYSAAMLTALTFVGVCAFAAWADFSGDGEKRLFDKIKWLAFKQIDPVRHSGMGRTVAEEAKIHVSNVTGYITILNSLFNSLLGEETNRGSYGIQVFMAEKLNSILDYFSGVAHTHDITYGLPKLIANELPIAKIVMSRLPSQEGLMEERNARTIIQRYAPQELLRSTHGSFGGAVPTEASPIKEALKNAIYRGDSIGVAEQYQALRTKLAELGRENPDRLAAEVFRSLNPYATALLGRPTDSQRNQMLSKLKPDERQMLLDAETRFLAASQMLDIGSSMVKRDTGTGSGGGVASGQAATFSQSPRGTFGTGGNILPASSFRSGGGGFSGGIGPLPGRSKFGFGASGRRRATMSRPRRTGVRQPRLRVASAPRRRRRGFSVGIPIRKGRLTYA